MNKKIVFLSVGSRGDIQPLVSMAKDLKALGTNILFCTHKEYSFLPQQNGLEFAEIPSNPVKSWERNKEKKEKSKSLWEQIEKEAREWLIAGLSLTADADAIVYNALFMVGQHLGEKLNIPYFPVIFEPNIPTKEFPIAYFPFQKNMGAHLNKLTYFLGPQIFWQLIRKKMNLFRKDELNLPPISWKGPVNKLLKDNAPILCCYSKFMLSKPIDWNENIQVTGYWFLDNENGYNTYPELGNYLSGDKPIFIDLGSFSSEKILPKVKIILNDLIEIDEKVLIAPGRIDVSSLNLPENSFILEREVPHQWLLPKVKTIISHGGVGVVHAALRAGIPNIPITIFAAQYFWGYKLYKKHLGSMPIPINKLKNGKVKSAIEYLKRNQLVLTKLKEVKNLIENENGAETASNFILNYLSKN